MIPSGAAVDLLTMVFGEGSVADAGLRIATELLMDTVPVDSARGHVNGTDMTQVAVFPLRVATSETCSEKETPPL
jgi:hypothetical protein